MSKKVIFVCIIEGKESYTEVYFFKNISNYLGKEIKLVPIAFAKASKESPTKLNNEKLNDQLLGDIDFDDKNEIIIHFIADGENRVLKKDNAAMQKTYENLKKEILDFCSALKLNRPILKSFNIYKNKSFEDMIGVELSKEESCRHGFQIFCESNQLFDYSKNNSLNESGVIEYFKDTEFEELFTDIFNK